MMTRRNGWLAVAAVVWVGAHPVLATERHVPAEYATIRAAIDACVNGDVVIVADGTYTGDGNKDLDFGGRAITVRSASGDPNTCVIDCEGSGRGFYFHTNETAAAIVQGLTIRNGKVTSDSPGGFYGGGVFCDASSPTLTNCTITSNRAGAGGGLCLGQSSATIAGNTITNNGMGVWGGGLCLLYSFPTIVNNTIMGNTSLDQGGGLFADNSSPTIVNNMIKGNHAVDLGGGMFLRSSSPMIANNMISNNIASQGAGLYLYKSSVTMANNTMLTNIATSRGGALYLNCSSPTIANNTITGNSASSDGGGLYLYSGAPTIANTIVAFNSSGIYRSSDSPTLRHNCVYGNTNYNYSGITDPTGTDANISADPLFRSPAGADNDPNTWADNDYHLLPGSPCIDAGSNSVVPADTLDLDGDGNTTEPLPFDLDGRPRFVDDSGTADCPWAPGTCGAAPIVDMGAYEFQGTTHLAGDLSCDGVVDFADINPFVLALSSQCSYETRFPNCRFLNADINGDGVVSFADINPFVRLLAGG